MCRQFKRRTKNELEGSENLPNGVGRRPARAPTQENTETKWKESGTQNQQTYVTSRPRVPEKTRS